MVMTKLFRTTVWFWFIVCSSFIFTNGQYQHCDEHKLQTCQQNIVTNVQDSQSYSGSGNTNSWQGDQQSKCSLIRQNLDCMITNMPLCQGRESSSITTNSVEVLRRAKTYLDRSCDQNGGWRSTSCYQRSEIRQCESQYNNQVSTTQVSFTSCRNFQSFHNCVLNYVRLSCTSQDLQLLTTYLIDKAQDLSWSCQLNRDYGTSRADGNFYPQESNNQGIRQPYPQYPTSGTGYNQNQGGYGQSQGTYGQQYGQNQGSYGHNQGGYGQQYGSQYGSQHGTNNYDQSSSSIDRSFFPTTDHCLERANYFVRSCEDTLIQRQRDAREGRSGYDVQRRICCALFFYRDCISRVVVDRCRDPSPTVVDILMGSRKRDLTVTCREYSRDQCSSSTALQGSFGVIFTLVFTFWFFKLDA